MSHLATALLHFQADPPAVHLDATNPHFGSKFASLGGVVAAVRPALTKHGLVVSQLPTYIGDGVPALETRLMHPESGEEIKSLMPLMMAKQDPQAQGSALTYARRYALLSILGLVGDADDDASATVSPRRGDARGDGTVETQPSDATPGVGQTPRGFDSHDLVIHFGKNSGKRLGDLSPKQIAWYAQTWEPNPQFANEADLGLKQAATMLHLGVQGSVATVVDDTSEIPF